MKMRNLFLTALLMMAFGFAKAQTWTPVLANVDGTNTFKGVEVYYMLSGCGASEVVILKLVNTNAKDVKAQWVTDIITTDEKEHYGKTTLVAVKLKANTEVAGTCNGKIKELVIKLSDFGVAKKDFSTIVASSFYVE
jgi:hypothetical protein